MTSNKCNDKDLSARGGSNPQQTEYINTLADYSGLSPAADNVIENTTCDSSVAIGNAVRMDVSTSTVFNALANNITNANVIGICISKSSATVCNVQVCGYTTSVLSGLDLSKNYFLSDSTPGLLTVTPPTASGSIVLIIGKPYTSSRFIIHLGNPIRRS